MVLVAEQVKQRKKLFTVDEYHKMGEVGIIHPDERVELIEGEIFTMAAMGRPHRAGLLRLNKILSKELGELATVGIQVPIILDDLSEPEPDVSLLIPRADYYAGIDPNPKDVYLLIEVSHTTLDYDHDKAITYSKSGIKELWIVNITADLIEVYRDPSAQGYQTVLEFRRGDSISPLAFPDLVLSVDELLGID